MFYLLNAMDHSWRSVDIDSISTAPDRSYSACPGRPTSASFHGQGLALDENDGGLKLLAVGHGGREAVEIFRIEVERDAVPTLVWVGCVVAPSSAQLNSVAALPGGGFVVTRFFDLAYKTWGEDMLAGRNTGSVLEWSPEDGWKEVEGTEMSGPNGILARPDGSAYFVAEWGAQRLHKFSRGASSD
jgi:sugar lactone lactonase YvrE